MQTQKYEYAKGTHLVRTNAWGLTVSGAAECPDGKVRKLKRISSTPDTFFSIPAAVRVNGKTVAGYVTIETVAGNTVRFDNDPEIVRFIPYTYRKNGRVFGDKIDFPGRRQPLPQPSP
jgi:hypothetical protein